eukprot:1154235-Pelagomonas_calceolata.AAC.3
MHPIPPRHPCMGSAYSAHTHLNAGSQHCDTSLKDQRAIPTRHPKRLPGPGTGSGNRFLRAPKHTRNQM